MCERKRFHRCSACVQERQVTNVTRWWQNVERRSVVCGVCVCERERGERERRERMREAARVVVAERPVNMVCVMRVRELRVQRGCSVCT